MGQASLVRRFGHQRKHIGNTYAKGRPRVKTKPAASTMSSCRDDRRGFCHAGPRRQRTRRDCPSRPCVAAHADVMLELGNCSGNGTVALRPERPVSPPAAKCRRRRYRFRERGGAAAASRARTNEAPRSGLRSPDGGGRCGWLARLPGGSGGRGPRKRPGGRHHCPANRWKALSFLTLQLRLRRRRAACLMNAGRRRKLHHAASRLAALWWRVPFRRPSAIGASWARTSSRVRRSRRSTAWVTGSSRSSATRQRHVCP